MITIWKYNIYPEKVLEIEIPKDAEILTVQTQSGLPVLWAMVNTETKKEKRRFAIYGTGHTIDEKFLKYIGTFQMHDGVLVWHVFEILKE